MGYKDLERKRGYDRAWRIKRRVYDLSREMEVQRIRLTRRRIIRRERLIAKLEDRFVSSTLTKNERDKVLRTLIRLKHSLHADRELLRRREEIALMEAGGVHAELETSLAELLSDE